MEFISSFMVFNHFSESSQLAACDNQTRSLSLMIKYVSVSCRSTLTYLPSPEVASTLTYLPSLEVGSTLTYLPSPKVASTLTYLPSPEVASSKTS